MRDNTNSRPPTSDAASPAPHCNPDELNKLSQKLSITESQLRLFMSAIKDAAIITLDPNGIITSWNEGAERLKGYRADEVVGKSFSVLYPESDIAAGKPQKMLTEARMRGSVEDEGWRTRKDGSLFMADVLLSAIRDQSGQLVGFAKITRDVSERRRAQDEIRALMEQREAFVAALTHDLKTPILAADRAIRLLIEGQFGEVTPSQSEILRTIADSNAAMYGLVALLLDVYRYDSGSKRLEIAAHQMTELIRTVIRQLQPLAREKRICLKAEIPDDVRPVLCDAAEITRVVQNLLSNAIKFSPEGGAVVVKLEQSPEKLTVSVRDTGPGIAPAQRKGLFERFYQPPSGGSPQSGSGLGLYLSRCIIEAHGGTIGYDSQRETGSAFWFSLPTKQPPA